MEITLEKIELVKDRTGVTYAEAKKALEEADGSVVDAIIAIEETVNSGDKRRGFGEKGEALFKSLKSLIKKGNVAKIQVKKDGDIVLNVPVNAGIVGICIAPLASVVAIVAAFGFKCVIEVVKTDGTIIDISDAVTEKMASAAELGSEYCSKAKEKADEYYGKAKDKAEDLKDMDIYEKAKDKAGEYYDKAKDKAEDLAEDLKDMDIYEKAKDKAGEYYGKAKDKAEDLKDTVKTDISEIIEEVEESADEIEKEIKEELKKEE